MTLLLISKLQEHLAAETSPTPSQGIAAFLFCIPLLLSPKVRLHPCFLVASISGWGSKHDSQTSPSLCFWTQGLTVLLSNAKLLSAASGPPHKGTFPQQFLHDQQTSLMRGFTHMFVLFCFLFQEP